MLKLKGKNFGMKELNEIISAIVTTIKNQAFKIKAKFNLLKSSMRITAITNANKR